MMFAGNDFDGVRRIDLTVPASGQGGPRREIPFGPSTSRLRGQCRGGATLPTENTHPVTDLDDLLAGLTPEERAAIADLDSRRLELERSRLSPAIAATVTSPGYGVFNRLRMWDALVRDMDRDWSSDYMVHEYLNMLDVRDGIEEILAATPVSLQGKIAELVSRLDHRFREATEDDGGTELARYSRRLALEAELSWWWTRRPKVLPPGW